jgi:cysteine dioxygenase
VTTIVGFTAGLARIPRTEFTLDRVQAYLEDNRVTPESLEPYRNFAQTHYTRNLIHKSEHFELMAVCWDVGQGSNIHNHSGQRCWMAVPIGRLAVQNYELVDGGETTGYCEIREADRLLMDPEHPVHVRPQTPIHAVLNLLEYNQPALSLHVYSLPYDRCFVYSKEDRRCREIPLFYDTEYGQPVS